MTDSLSTRNTPVLWINKYLQEKIGLMTGYTMEAFFPTGPSTLETLQKQFPEGNMVVWDRMFRMRRGAFPHIKCEQVLYYFYAMGDNSGVPSIVRMINIQEAVLRLMDRGDESAEDLNKWARNNPINFGTPQNPDFVTCKFYFHNFKIYQLEEARDIVDFGTARTYAGNKIIIDYDYHPMQDIIDSANA
jgi:hypothetical protein